MHSHGKQNSHIPEHTGSAQNLYKCVCGRNYSALPPVYAHIKTKHPNEVQKYRREIVKPARTKPVQPAEQVSFRLSHVQRNKTEENLLNQADDLARNLYCCNKNDGILLHADGSGFDSDDSDLELEELIGIERGESKRRTEIKKKVWALAQTHRMADVIEAVEQDKQLQTFRMDKQRLNLVTSATKLFVIGFAAQVEFSLLLIHAAQKLGKTQKLQSISATLAQLWSQNARRLNALRSYYQRWISTRSVQQRNDTLEGEFD